MKVLGLACSPRKEGNTQIMVEEALHAAEEFTLDKRVGAETKILLASEMDISPCDACGSCQQTGVCRIKDDMQTIYLELEEADGIIFGSPVYFANVSAQAKAIMDRTYALVPGKKLKGKVVGPVVVAWKSGASQARNLLYSFFMYQEMITIKGAIGYGNEKGDVRLKDFRLMGLEQAKILGKSVAEMIYKLDQ